MGTTAIYFERESELILRNAINRLRYSRSVMILIRTASEAARYAE
jgi:hypothetical protein